jgi:hypothetical protein
LRKIFEIKSSFGEDCLQTEVEFEKKSYEEEHETGNFMLYVKYALCKKLAEITCISEKYASARSPEQNM